ncbi:MAG: endo-1,4-beta-xylanase [Verrucomicrobiota bacterium]
MKKHFNLAGLVLVLLSSTCIGGVAESLKGVFKDDFLVGAAINRDQIFGEDARGDTIIKAQFNSITPENILKWQHVHPQPGEYVFEAPDRYVQFGESNGMFIVGHTLVWHSQTPEWVFQDERGRPLKRDALLARMREHIFTVMGRYKGRIKGWDVVNEAVAENGRLRQTPWLKIIGEDYLVKAYQFAHEADPQAELYYNDYGLENPAKRAGAVALVKKLQAAGVKISAVGIQGHYQLDSTSPTVQEVDDTITAFARLGVKANITELDVDVLPSAWAALSADVSLREKSEARLNPYTNGLPAEVQAQLAARYAELFAVFLKHSDDLERVTFWGVTDADSWLNDWPVAGRTSYPLLFDQSGKVKLAFDAVVKTKKNAGQFVPKQLGKSQPDMSWLHTGL